MLDITDEMWVERCILQYSWGWGRGWGWVWVWVWLTGLTAGFCGLRNGLWEVGMNEYLAAAAATAFGGWRIGFS